MTKNKQKLLVSQNFEAWKIKPELATEGVFFLKKRYSLKILQNSQENTRARLSFLIKLQALGLQLY